MQSSMTTWIDTHAHIARESPTLSDDLQAVFAADSADLRLVISPGVGFLAEMCDDPEAGRSAADCIQRLVAAFPNRFYGACCVNLNFPDEALRLMDLCLGQYGFVMLGEMLGYILRFDMNTSAGEQVVRKAVEYDVPVQIHLSTSNSPHQGHTSGLGQLDDILGIAERVPEARYILAHMIGMADDDPPVVRAYLDRIDERCGRWPDNFWAEIIDFHSPGVAEALMRIPHDRLLVGTDWCTRIGPPYLPYGVDHLVWSGGECAYEPSVARLVEFLTNWGATEDDIRCIAWRNAVDLLGLDVGD
ncbi:MAG: amidohydrolase [Kiritimatiellaeota bacterium]|nr:amidohydrolase [Kiritimatiellota bacterium]